MVLNGKTVVFTGTLPLLRAKAADGVREMGGVVQPNVTAATSILVMGSGANHTTKTAKARAHGLEVWSATDFMEVLECFRKDASGGVPRKRKAERCDTHSPLSANPPSKRHQNAPAGRTSSSQPHIRVYCNKGGDKAVIAKAMGYGSESDSPPLVANSDDTARHLALAPVDLHRPLNFCVEGADPQSPAWSIMHALGIHPAYHSSAKVVRALPSAVSPDVWAALSRYSKDDAFVFTMCCRDGPRPSQSPVVYGTFAEGHLVGCLSSLAGVKEREREEAASRRL